MNINQVSKTHASFSPAFFEKKGKLQLGRDYSMDDVKDVMKATGIGFKNGSMQRMYKAYQNAVSESVAMDTIQQPLTTASALTPVQFLQNWLPGNVSILTAARKIDRLVGLSTVGAWEDEQIVQQLIEPTGTPVPYGDITNIPFSNYNLNFVYRTVVRFEQGMRIGNLEQARAARVMLDSAGEKRKAASLQLEICRNQIGFFGYNSGANLTYGFLNDPNLPNYQTVATSGTSWAAKTFLQIQTDILTALQALRTQSQDTIEPNKTPITLVVSTNKVDYLSKTSDFGISVYDWLKQFYPNVRVESAPQLVGANGGADVFYLYADTVDDGLSTDDQRTFIQVVPAKFQVLGVAQQAKGYEEDYSNATAGIMVKRPYAVYRATGI